MDDLCVIVVSHNNKGWLDAALGSVWAHRGEIEPDVVVVDNGVDGAAEHVEANYPFARTLRCENRGFAHANNVALASADARYVLFLNPDTELLEGSLSDLVQAMDAMPAVGLAGVRQLRPDTSLAPTIRRFPAAIHTLAESLGSERVSALNRRLGERLLDPRVYERRTSCDWVTGSFMLVRSAALEAVGPLDERFFLFSEETDLCWRLGRAGWEVQHLPQMTIRHEESDGWANSRLVAQNAYARIQFAEKNFGPVHRRLDRLALGFRYSLRLARHAGPWGEGSRREASRAALGAVVRKSPPFARADRPVHLTAAGGGHIDLLCAVDGAFRDRRRSWVLHPSLHADQLVAAGEDVAFLPLYRRRLTKVVVSSFVCAFKLVLRGRPKVVVTSGAGVTVPYCAIARLMGARVIFVETMARVTGPSASGKVLSRLAALTLVQWPDVLGAYPRSRLCRPALLESIATADAPAGKGTLVAVGTHSEPFDRMLRMVDDAVAEGVLPTPIIAQGGVSAMRPENYELRDWMTPEEMNEAVGEAEYVVCHAGSGLVSAALRSGKRPMVLPRLAAHGEHFDDHQMQITEKLAELGLVVHLRSAITPADLEAAKRPLAEENPVSHLPSVEEALRAELQAALGAPGADAQAAAAAAAPRTAGAISRS